MTKFEYLYIGFRLIGRGYTGELADLHINGVPSEKYQRLPVLLADLGAEGWDLKACGDKGEHGTWEKMVFQRTLA